MEDGNNSVYRKETIARISSPEQLTDYLCVTNPGIWVILSAVIIFLGGLFAWSSIGVLETSRSVRVVVEAQTAQVIPDKGDDLSEGMPLRIGRDETLLSSTGVDDSGRKFGIAKVDLPDGTYDGTVVVESVHPMDFLLESR